MYISNIKSELSKINSKYSNINYGACGTFSYHLSEKLDTLGIENKIVYIPEINTPVDSYRCDIKFQHILVKVGDYLIDNNNVYHYDSIFTLELEKEKLKLMLSDKKLWNSTFPYEDWEKLGNDINNLNIKI